jgi:hypothetical protein
MGNKPQKCTTEKVLGATSMVAIVLIPLSILPGLAMAALPISVSASVALNFGTLTDGGAGGTVVVNTAGVRTTTGSVSAISGGGLVAQGVFNVSGSTGVAMDVSVTAPTVNVSNGGGATMSVNVFNLVTNAGGANNTITLIAGTNTFPLGATLNVGGGQAAGTYVGNYTLNVIYQ